LDFGASGGSPWARFISLLTAPRFYAIIYLNNTNRIRGNALLSREAEGPARRSLGNPLGLSMVPIPAEYIWKMRAVRHELD